MITGPWAEKFVAKANEMGWKITLDHMTETPPRWVEPIRYRHHEYEVVSLGPPQAQGIYIAIVLGVLKHLGLRDMKPGSADHWWAMGQALRQGARHWEYVQDDAIYGVPRAELLDDSYHAHLAKLVRIRGPRSTRASTSDWPATPAAGPMSCRHFLAQPAGRGSPRQTRSSRRVPASLRSLTLKATGCR